MVLNEIHLLSLVHQFWLLSFSSHSRYNFKIFDFPLILLIFECRFETFNIFNPLFFPRHYKHEIKNQTRQPNPNFNYLSHSKPPNSFSDCYTTQQISASFCSLSLSLSFIYSQCNHHQNPPPPLIPSQSTTTASHKPKIHNTTKIRLINASQNQIKPKSKKKKKKNHEMVQSDRLP